MVPPPPAGATLELFHNATCIVRSSGGTRLLCDPWFHDGAFLGSWCLPARPAFIPRYRAHFDALYVSHAHPDHCDETFLAGVDRACPVVIPREPIAPVLRRKLERLGFNDLRALADRDTIAVGDLRLTLFLPFQRNRFDGAAELPNFLDSALLVRGEDFSFLDTNDNFPTVEALRAIEDAYGPPDVLTLLYNSAGYYPQCSDDLDHGGKLRARERVLHACRAKLLEAALASRAGHVLPFGGEYLLGGAQRSLNAYLPASTPEAARDFLLAHGRPAIAMGHGGVYSFAERAIVRRGVEESERAYLGLWPAWHAAPAPDRIQLGKKLAAAAGRLHAQQARLRCYPPYRVRFVDPDGALLGELDAAGPRSAAHLLVVRLDARLLDGILDGTYAWDHAQVGCHMRFRDSNHPAYSPDLHVLLSFLR